jgi:RNA polymerase sigma-70 factor (ECF subfamily)
MFDRSAFESLFRSEFKGLVRFAITYVKDYEAAREVVQEAFLTLWEKRAEIDMEKSVKTYLSTTVRNRSLNHLRDNKKFDAGLLGAEGVFPDKEARQSDTLELKELKSKIDDAVNGLPERCREIFLLNRNEHLKYQEIADKLDISVKTVETQMSKALQHLRENLKDYLMVLFIFLILGSG